MDSGSLAYRESLDTLFRPRRVAIVGAAPNDPRRMGTRTMYDLVNSAWQGEIFPISTRHEEIYGRCAYASLRDVPAPPDVVLARVPAPSVGQVVDDACAVGARNLVVLASGFAESGGEGVRAQREVIEAASRGGVRILGPQSIGLVNLVDGLPLSLSQIMERLTLRAGRVALVTQSGAMAISLSVRGQESYGVGFSYVVTLGNAADIDMPEAMQWLASDANTAVVGLYLESARGLASFADAVVACRSSGKQVVVLRSGTSAKGAKAVASHTASMVGDSRVFEALCAQLGVILVDTGESFLVALKALSVTIPAAPLRTAFASVSGGACALWADGAERSGYTVPDLGEADAHALAMRLPPFLKPCNPLDLGPAMFDPEAFADSIRALSDGERFDLLVVYLFTSSPSLMGGLERIAQLEALAARSPIPVWVAWEAATPEEWERLVRSTKVVAFRELGQAVLATRHVRAAHRPIRYRQGVAPPPMPPDMRDARTEGAIKRALRNAGLPVPDGMSVHDADHASLVAAEWGGSVVLKVQGPEIAHKSELDGVIFCRDGAAQVRRAFRELQENLASHGVGGPDIGVYVERMVEEAGLEMFVTVRHDEHIGWITSVGRGGKTIEVERDFDMCVGELTPDDVLDMLKRLRCAPLLRGFRGQAPLDSGAFARLVSALPACLGSGHGFELELNPVKVIPHGAWILDALLTRGEGETGR